MNLRQQPKARQRALLAEWGIDEMIVTSDGIQDEGIWVVGAEPLPDGWRVAGGVMVGGSLPKTLYAYPTVEAKETMLRARGDDWLDYVKSIDDTPANGAHENE